MTDRVAARAVQSLRHMIESTRECTRRQYHSYPTRVELSEPFLDLVLPALSIAVERLEAAAADADLAALAQAAEEAEGPLPAVRPLQGRPIGDLTAEELRALYAECGTASGVAERLRCHPSTARNHLRRHGILYGEAVNLAVWQGGARK